MARPATVTRGIAPETVISATVVGFMQEASVVTWIGPGAVAVETVKVATR
jgi:hypothetical protein